MLRVGCVVYCLWWFSLVDVGSRWLIRFGRLILFGRFGSLVLTIMKSYGGGNSIILFLV